MNVKEIVEKYLRDNGYDGLAGHECGCLLGDLMPCADNQEYCEPGIKKACSCGKTDCPDWEVVASKNKVSVWWMYDNHTFTKLTGNLEQIIAEAKELVKTNPYGMLCPPIVLNGNGKELRRLKQVVHANIELGNIDKWEAEIRADAEVMSLLAEQAEQKVEHEIT